MNQTTGQAQQNPSAIEGIPAGPLLAQKMVQLPKH